MAFSYTESDELKRLREMQKQNEVYKMSERVAGLERDMNAIKEQKPTDWLGGTYGDQVKGLNEQIQNYKPFSYDLNGDMLYQQYKNQYINHGRQAMMDTMGQAAAMTGGYGNSYAQTVGQQTYQGYLNGLNDRIPELYQLAMNKYQNDYNMLRDRYDVANSAYNQEYGEYRDKVSDWNNDFNNAYNMFNNERANEQSMWASDRDYYANAANNLDQQEYNRQFGEYQQRVSEDQAARDYALRQMQADQSARISSLQAQLDSKSNTQIDMTLMNKYAAQFNGKSYNDIKNAINKAADNGDINEYEYNYLIDKYLPEPLTPAEYRAARNKAFGLY